MSCAAYVRIQNYRDPPLPDQTIETGEEAKAEEAAAKIAAQLKSETQTIEET